MFARYVGKRSGEHWWQMGTWNSVSGVLGGLLILPHALHSNCCSAMSRVVG